MDHNIFVIFKDQTKVYCKTYVAFLMLMLFSGFVVNAQTTTWQGGATGAWNIAGNWDNGVPGTGDHAIINNATVNLGGGTINIGSIAIQGGGLSNGILNTGNTNNTSTFSGGSDVNVTLNLVNKTIELNGAHFFQECSFAKTGNAIAWSSGGNTFEEKVTLKNNSATGYFILGSGNPDIFKKALEIDTQKTIYLASSGTGHEFHGDITIHSSSPAWIGFGLYGGKSTMAPGVKIIPSTNLTGTLVLAGIDLQTDLTFNTPNLHVFFGNYGTGALNKSNFRGAVDVSAKIISLNGSTFHGIARLTYDGGGSHPTYNGLGGNTFMQDAYLTMINSTNGSFVTATSAPDTFKGDVYVVNEANSGGIYLSHVAKGNVFEKNVYLKTSQASISIGSGGGTSTLPTGAKIEPLGGNGLTGGGVLLWGLDMTEPLDLNIANTRVNLGGVTNRNHFKSDVNLIADAVSINGNTFDQSATITYAGNITHYNTFSAGSNIFNGPATLNLTGSGTFLMSRTYKDVFKNTLTVESGSAGVIHLAHNDKEANEYHSDVSLTTDGGFITMSSYQNALDFSFAHNLTLNSSSPGKIIIGSQTGGKLTLNGTIEQTITHTGANDYHAAHVHRLDVNNSGGRILLGTNLEIKQTMAFTQGMVKTTGAHGLLIFDEDATYTGVTNTKYVSGKVQKKGSVSFVFPIGSDTQYRPLATNVTSGSAPVTVYFVEGPEPTGIAPPACYEIATCEHWVVNSDNSVITFNVAVNITGSCVDPLPSNPLVAWFDKTQWNFLDATIQPVDMLTAIPTVTTVPNSTQSGDHYVTIGSKLSLPGGNVMTGSASVCQNTSQIYSVPSAPNTTYSWKLPIGWSIASSNPNSHQITVTVASNAPVGTQTIAVYPSQVANCEFCELAPITLEVTVNAQPNVGSVVGPTTAKAGQSNMTYSVTNTTGADEFVWTLPAGVVENGSGATGTITTTVPYITVDFVTGFAGGNINVYGTSTTCGNGPTVSMFVSLCTTCRTSNSTLPDNLKNNHLTVFPNPIMGSEKIKVQIEGQTEVSVVNIVIVDEKGAKVKTFVQELQNGIVEIPGQSLAPGKYLLRIQVGSEIVGKKILKY